MSSQEARQENSKATTHKHTPPARPCLSACTKLICNVREAGFSSPGAFQNTACPQPSEVVQSILPLPAAPRLDEFPCSWERASGKLWLTCGVRHSSGLCGLSFACCLLALCWLCFLKVGGRGRQEAAPRGEEERESVAAARLLSHPL